MTEEEKGQEPTVEAVEGQGPEAVKSEGQEPTVDARTLEELKKLRKEHKSLRERLRQYEEAEKKRGEPGEDTEKLKVQLAEAQAQMAAAEQRIVEVTMRSAVVSKAAQLGFNDPEDAWRLIDLAALEADEEGNVSGIEEQLNKLLKEKPYLAKAKTISPTNPVAGPQKPSDEQLRKEIFGAGKSKFWEGGGIIMPEK